MTMIDRRMMLLGSLALAACGKGSGGGGSASDPVRMILPLSVGSTGDTVARRLVEGLSKTLGRSIFVENLPGAGGIIGSEKLVHSEPDGNTLATVSSNYVVNPGIYPSMTFDTLKDITPIAVIGDSPQVLLVNPSLGVRDFKSLVALAKAKPGTLHYGSSGNGTALHLLGVKLSREAGINIVHVPYKGNAQMLSDLIGGQVPMAFQSTTQAAPYVKSGKLIPLGITSKDRSRLLTNVPTLAEQGLPGFDLSTWMAVIAPAKMDPAMTNKLNAAVNAALALPDVTDWLHKQDWRLTPMSSAQAKQFLADEQAKYLQLVKQSGAKM